MKFSWLHLTDLHIGMPEQGPLLPTLKDRFCADLKSLYATCEGWDLVILSGDLTYSGQRQQYEDLNKFLNCLWDQFNELGCSPSLVAVPGNHDLVWPDQSDDVAHCLVTTISGFDDYVRSNFWREAQKSRCRTFVEEAFENYQQWWKQAPHRLKPTDGLLPGDFSATLEKEGGSIGIVGLNSAFLQLSKENYAERLLVDTGQFHAVCEGDGPAWIKKHNACLLVTHHPGQWLRKKSCDDFKGEIAGYDRFVAHLCGHMHESDYSVHQVGGSSPFRIFQAMSLFGLDHYTGGQADRSHGYVAGRIDVTGSKGSYTLWPRKAIKDASGQWEFVPDAAMCGSKGNLSGEFTPPRPLEEPPISSVTPNVAPAGNTSRLPPRVDPPGAIGSAYALVIGISKYRKKDRLNLKYATSDARALATFLQEQRYQVRLLVDRQAKRRYIMHELDQLAQRCKDQENPLVLVYFSGHGAGDPQGRYYLIPHDADPDDLFASAVSNKVFNDALDQIKTERLIVFLDACHSGGVSAPQGTKAANLPYYQAPVLEPIDAVATKYFITSCAAQESSHELDQPGEENQGYGIFSNHLLQLLKGEDERFQEVEEIGLKDLYEGLKKNVSETARKKGWQQTPSASFEGKLAELPGIVLAPNTRFKALREGMQRLTEIVGQIEALEQKEESASGREIPHYAEYIGDEGRYYLRHNKPRVPDLSDFCRRLKPALRLDFATTVEDVAVHLVAAYKEYQLVCRSRAASPGLSARQAPRPAQSQAEKATRPDVQEGSTFDPAPERDKDKVLPR